MASTFSGDEERVISRTLDESAHDGSFELEVAATAAAIRRGGFRRVALQFPDALLAHSQHAVQGLRDALQDEAIDVFVLGDTAFDGYQVDFVAAQHLHADFIVHYGPVDLEAEGPLPVFFVLGRRALPVGPLAAACATAFPVPGRVLVVSALPYVHAAPALAEALASTCPSALVCGAELERPAALGGKGSGQPASEGSSASNARPTEDDSVFRAVTDTLRGRLLGRTLPMALDEAELAECQLLYVGNSEDGTLANLCMLLPASQGGVYVYTPPADYHDDHDGGGGGGGGGGGASPSDGKSPPPPVSIRRLELPTARRLMRRYFLVQKAREAEIVGILIGTLSAARRGAMLAEIKALCRRAGRKQYVFLMGKLNAAKLANFIEVGVYVLIGSPEHSLIDAKDFYRPVVTPYELHLALSSGADWSGRYILDYARLLPHLMAESGGRGDGAAASAGHDEGGVGVGGQGGGQGGDGDGDASDDDDDDDEPHFSLLSGRLIRQRPARERQQQQPQQQHAAAAASTATASSGDAGATDAAAAAAEGVSHALIASDGGQGAASGSGTLSRRGPSAVARSGSGAEALALRSYRGLDPRIGEHAPARVVDGLTGIASSFENEGDRAAEGRRRAAAAAAAASDVPRLLASMERASMSVAAAPPQGEAPARGGARDEAISSQAGADASVDAQPTVQ